jgi:phenylacetate-CoA ligase
MVRFPDQPDAARRLRAIVDWARRSNPFYAEWIADPEHVPILDRTTFVANNDRILNGRKETGRTSGSTAEPARFHRPEAARQAQVRDVERLVAKLGGRRRPVIIRRTWTGIKGPTIIDLLTPIDTQIDMILKLRREQNIDALSTYPTNVEMLGLRVRERGVDFSFLRRVGLYGEMITPAQLRVVKEAFPNAQFWSTYSTTEFGLIGSGCFSRVEYYHLMIHRLGIEIVDEDGNPVPEGTPGRVIVTDFINRECPFIRYDTGDRATWEPSGCGIDPLPTIHSIHGKTRAALLHRSGDRMLCAALASALRDMPRMRQFQVVQEKLEHFIVRIICTEKVDQQIRSAFREHFGYLPRRLIIQYVDDIPRDTSGKFHIAICKV